MSSWQARALQQATAVDKCSLTAAWTTGASCQEEQAGRCLAVSAASG
eukprot:CAMPEP_0183562066 /NCGR_PEP_ID=MMETSP0371-20130417/97142_1 /TAXON_ID=268820 /ORGANISM="Peridinium aciculiferum, Strain PAER-2" /LENGTH=46 /DNA_ID= /DNA_START= /DNA_END= /DNA_ORIENTATION=